jgi:hypothetical protein
VKCAQQVDIGARRRVDADDGRGSGRGAGKEVMTLYVAPTCQRHLEQLARDAEWELALESSTARGFDQEAGVHRPSSENLEERGLADARLALDEQQLPRTGRRSPDGIRDGADLRTALKQIGRGHLSL